MRLNQQLLAGLQAQNSSAMMIQTFVIIAVALGIASVLGVSVIQKSRQIGILKATGTRTGTVMRIFLIEGAARRPGRLRGRRADRHRARRLLPARGEEPIRRGALPGDARPRALRHGGAGRDRNGARGVGLPRAPRRPARSGYGDPQWLSGRCTSRGWSKDYGEEPVRTRALHGVDLRVDEGEFTAIMGPSGSGKSTLLNLIGLLDRPTAGRVTIDGLDTGTLDDDGLAGFRGRSIGFVFQFHHLLPEFTAIENVMLPMMADKGRAEPGMAEHARHLLVEVGLEGHLHKKVTLLSGGQAQRVAVARALAMTPRIVLADEPTGNLDTRSADEIFALLRDFNRHRGVTFLVVTHDPRLAARCDRIVEVVDGRIVGDRANARVGP